MNEINRIFLMIRMKFYLVLSDKNDMCMEADSQ